MSAYVTADTRALRLRECIRAIANYILGLLTWTDAWRCRLRGHGRPRVVLTNATKAILVVRTEAKLGDALLHIPFLRTLKTCYPGHAVHLVHHRAVRDVYVHCPYVDHRIEISSSLLSFGSLINRLVICHDLARSLPVSAIYQIAYATSWDDDLHSPFILWFAGALQRITFASDCTPRRRARNRGIDLLATHTVLDRAVRHESERASQLLPVACRGAGHATTILEFWWSAEDESAAMQKLTAGGVTHDRYIVVAPGAASGRRRWPIDRFAAFIKRLRDSVGVEIVVLGSMAERAECATLCDVAGLPSACNFAGGLPLAASAALLQRALLFVGNDSGLMHLASACQTPSIEISCHPIGSGANHPNSPRRFGPTSPCSFVAQPPGPASLACKSGCVSDEPHCIALIEIDVVVTAAVGVLADPQRYKSVLGRSAGHASATQT